MVHKTDNLSDVKAKLEDKLVEIRVANKENLEWVFMYRLFQKWCHDAVSLGIVRSTNTNSPRHSLTVFSFPVRKKPTKNAGLVCCNTVSCYLVEVPKKRQFTGCNEV